MRARSKENVSVFRYYVKSKTDNEFPSFPSVKFRNIWQTVGNYFTLVGASFSGKSLNQFFGSGERHKFEKIEKNCPY